MFLFESKIRDLYGIRAKKGNTIAADAVGVEIEMELSPSASTPDFAPNIMAVQDTFEVKSDGSLRNFGVEFVSQPMSIKSKDKMLGHWEALLSSPMLATRIDGCPRASVHVHVNVLDKTYNQLMSILLAYSLLEGPMVAYCGKYRMGNLFALRIPEADSVFKSITRRIPDFSRFSLSNDNRYSALNLVSVSKFGTVEFRSMGAVYDPQSIDTWVTGVQNLVEVASKFKNAPEIYDFYSQVSKSEFIMRFLGEGLGNEILKRNLDIENLMEDGEEYAIMLLASSVDDWTHEKDFRKDKEFRDYSKSHLGYSDSQILSMSKDQYQSITREMLQVRNVRSSPQPQFTISDFNSDPEPTSMWADDAFDDPIPDPSEDDSRARSRVAANRLSQAFAATRPAWSNITTTNTVSIDTGAFDVSQLLGAIPPERNR